MKKLRFDSTRPTGRKRKADNKKNPHTILEAFECIVDLVNDSGLKEEFFQEADACISFAAKKLQLSKMQTVLLSIFVDKSEDTRIRQSEIASYVDVRTTRILQLADDIDELVARRYLRSSKRYDDLTYRVPMDVLKALRANKPYEFVEEPVTDTNEFFDRIVRLLKEKDDDEISYEHLKNDIVKLLDEDIKDTVFAKGLARHRLDDNDVILFVFMAHLFVENLDDNIQFHDIEKIYDNNEIPGHIKRLLRTHKCKLFKEGLIENVNEDGLARSDAYKLTDKAKEELLNELHVFQRAKSEEDLLSYKSLTKKKLIYNAAEKGQINELSSILSAKRFKEVQGRLKESGMRQGFCCLFYGTPGTGKTETVYQLAMQTGRDIMRVDVDKVKSCWVGESEKNIKKLFDRYRSICKEREKNGELAPILLFNEADAVLGVRMEGASRAVDKMENSIQNIILQEMESLEGIMIATTNLTTNLDKAFERRFLYKIKFEKPSLESRALIWKSMLASLKKKDSEYLAKKFDLSGGEIENVVRRITVNSILHGNTAINLKAIEEICKLERINNSKIQRIGF